MERKSKSTALVLCIFFGWFGAHRYYVGKIPTGLLYTFTFGLFFIGWFVDIYFIASDQFLDGYQQPLLKEGQTGYQGAVPRYSQTGWNQGTRTMPQTAFRQPVPAAPAVPRQNPSKGRTVELTCPICGKLQTIYQQEEKDTTFCTACGKKINLKNKIESAAPAASEPVPEAPAASTQGHGDGTPRSIRAYNGTDPFIFISYAHRNGDKVVPIIAKMQADGYRVWYDEGIDPGTEWDANIATHVRTCGLMIAFLSKEYLDSENCKDELNFARDLGKNRILVYLEDIVLPDGMAMRLNRLQAIHQYRYEDQNEFYSKLYDSPDLAGMR